MFVGIVAEFGTPSLIALGVVLILTGRLVPRRTLLDVQRDRDRWREAYLTTEQSRRLEAVHTGELLEAAHTTAHVLRALPVVTRTEADPDATVAR